MTHSRLRCGRILSSLLVVCLWFMFTCNLQVATADDEPEKSKPAATSESDPVTPAKAATDEATASDDDPEKAKRTEEYHLKREAELQHVVKEQSDEFRELAKEEERFQTFAFIAGGAVGILLVGLFVFSRVRKK